MSEITVNTTGTNWIKMRDISDSVEKWLIR